MYYNTSGAGYISFQMKGNEKGGGCAAAVISNVYYYSDTDNDGDIDRHDTAALITTGPAYKELVDKVEDLTSGNQNSSSFLGQSAAFPGIPSSSWS